MASGGQQKTIFALATGGGPSALAVVRLSGPSAGPALEKLAGRLPAPRRASLASLRDPRSGELLDDALVLWFPGPASYTGEDLAELHLHGSRAVIAAALEVLGREPDLRPAEAGEFTRRAFNAGRLDLTAVEGLADLIDAETQMQRRQALRQLRGGLAERIEGWRERLMRAAAHYEALIDFADEDLPPAVAQEVCKELRDLASEIERQLDDARVGERLRDGITVAILGAPNAGKSSLLNALASRDAAIVSESAGTTRDSIEVHLDLRGFPVTLVDTAGLRDLADETMDPVEAEGIRRSLERGEQADLKLVLFDAALWPELDRHSAALLDADSLAVLSRCDLMSQIPQRPEAGGWRFVPCSVVSVDGLRALTEDLAAAVSQRFARGVAEPLVTRERHRSALADCLSALHRFETTEEVALAAEELRLALRALGRVVGRVDVEDLLDVVFRDFCIGK